MATLIFNVKAEYFDAIRDGTKLEEFRLRNDYWKKRLSGKTFNKIIVKKGYPKDGDAEREIHLPYRGYREITLTHPHFGDDPVEVFAFRVSERSPV